MWSRANQSWNEAHPCKLFVGNISYRVTRCELSEAFSQFGEVEFTQIVKDHKKQWSRGIGFVTFKNVESAERALNATDNDLTLDGRVLRVCRPAKPKRRMVAELLGDVASDNEVGGANEPGREGDGLDSSCPDGSDGDSPVLASCWSPTLNSDSLIHVFSYLHLKDRVRVERVCKSWRRAALLLWKTVKTLHFRDVFVSFRGKYGGLTDDILHSILKRGCHGLRELDLSASCQYLTDFALDLIGMYCTNLERVDLSRMSVSQSSFKHFTQRCCHIKWLRLSGCHQVGEKGLWWALNNWTSLEYLNITSNRRITGQCFYLIGLPSSSSDPTQSKGHLKTIILENCSSVTDDGLVLLTKHSLQGIPSLEHINISHCQLLSGVAISNVTAVSL